MDNGRKISWENPQFFGDGHCTETPTYESAAFELAHTWIGLDSFDSQIYMDWVNRAGALCKDRDPSTTHVSVWYNAGYRCYTGTCQTNNDSTAKTWVSD